MSIVVVGTQLLLEKFLRRQFRCFAFVGVRVGVSNFVASSVFDVRCRPLPPLFGLFPSTDVFVELLSVGLLETGDDLI